MEIQYRAHMAHWAGSNANTIQDLHPQYTTYSHNILYWQYTKLMPYSEKHMIHDTDNIHNIRHTMLDLNNSCTTLMVYNTSQKIQHSIAIHNAYTDNTI